MRYAVTGGAGFIGSTLTEALLKEGHEVVIIDNLTTGKRERIPEGVTFIEGSITDMDACRRAFEGVDGVFHLAAIPRMPYSIEHPIETNEVNVNGTLTVLVAARDAGVKRVVYSSSSSLYGRQEILPFVETMKACPLNPYGLQKFMGEEYARIFAELFKIETVSLRYFNVYGGKFQSAGGSYPLVIALFLDQKKNGVPFTLTGDGEYRRDFTHVYDVVRANMLSMTSEKVGHGEAMNIGAGNNFSVSQVADLIGGEKSYIPDRPGDPRATLADNSKARELIGWVPQITLEEGIAELKKLHKME